MGSRLFRPSGEGRVVFSGQPEVDCTSWSVSQHSSCYSYFRFVKVIYRLIRPSVEKAASCRRAAEASSPRGLCHTMSSCGMYRDFVKEQFFMKFVRGSGFAGEGQTRLGREGQTRVKMMKITPPLRGITNPRSSLGFDPLSSALELARYPITPPLIGITPPLRGSRQDEAEGRSRAGGGYIYLLLMGALF